MTEALIVSTARTPIGKAHKGALNHAEGANYAGAYDFFGTRTSKNRRRRGKGCSDGLCHAAGHDWNQYRA